MRHFVFFLFITLLSACATNDPIHTASSTAPTSKWQGMSADALMKSMGTPNITATAQNGDKLLVYTTQTYQSYPSSPSFGTPMVVSAGGLPIVTAAPPPMPNNNFRLMKCTRTFEMNKENKVVSVKEQGYCH